MSDTNQYKYFFGEAMPQIVHDIRNPLNIIIGYSSILQMDASLSSESKQYIQKIYQSGLAIEDLLSDIDFFDLDTSEFEPEKIIIGDTVRQYVDYYKNITNDDITVDIGTIDTIETTLSLSLFKKLFTNLFGFSNKGFKISSSHKKVYLSIYKTGKTFKIFYSDTTSCVSFSGDYFSFDDSIHARRGLYPLFLNNITKKLNGTIHYYWQTQWKEVKKDFSPNTEHGFVIELNIT